MKKNLVLIGMPGAGKSTVGVLLAKHLAFGFLDTDLLIQERFGCPLQQILDRDGCSALLAAEEKTLLSLAVSRKIIATGGSAVYSEKAMAHLQQLGIVAYLSVTLPTIRNRVQNAATRGIVRRAGQDLDAIFFERLSLYQRYAAVTVDAESGTPDDVVLRLAAATAPFLA